MRSGFGSSLLLGCLLAFTCLGTADAQTTPITAAVTWPAVTTNTDGTALTGAVTYNLYQGVSGAALASVQTGLTTLTATVNTGLTAGSNQCFAVTAVVAGVESAQSLQACVTLNPETPNGPGQPTVTIS